MPYERSGGRQCAVYDCKNNQKKMYDWKTSICELHGVKKQDCPCLAPFMLHSLPSDTERRCEWLRCINRKDFNPTSKSRVLICSDHFIDGWPTKQNPNPTINHSTKPVTPGRGILHRRVTETTGCDVTQASSNDARDVTQASSNDARDVTQASSNDAGDITQASSKVASDETQASSNAVREVTHTSIDAEKDVTPALEKESHKQHSRVCGSMSYVLTHPSPETCDHSYSILSGKICANEPSPEYMERFDEVICDFMREQGVPGAALCLSLHGKIIYRQGFGISGPGQSMTSSSHFRIASISKVITAIGIMRLVENGRLELDQLVLGQKGILSHIHVSKSRQDDIGSIKIVTSTTLIGFSGILSHIHVSKSRQDDIGSITIRHLLQHSGGWDREKDGDQVFWYTKQPHRHFLDVWNNWSLVMYVLACPLRFSPGTKHAYSNFGYLLLGLVIERVTKMRYEEYIRSILREVGMEGVEVGKTKRDPVHFTEVHYYNNKDPQVERSVFAGEGHVQPQYGSFPMENTAAFGGLVTCAENLVTIIDGLNLEYDVPWIVTTDSIIQMLQKPSYARRDDEAWYGLGLDVDDAGSSFGHTGAMEGTSTTVHHCKNGLTWCLLMNSWAKDMDLDGLVKFALASIPGLPLWQQSLPSIEMTDYQVMSADMVQCVRILLPLAEVETHVDLMRREGYRIAHLSVLNVGSDVLFTIVWNKNIYKKTFGIDVDIELSNFEEEMKRMRGQKAKILYLEPYWRGRDLRHVCVYEKSSGSLRQRFYCIDDNKKHLKSVVEHRSIGYELRAQSYLYDSKGSFWVTALYDKISPSGSLEQRLWNILPIEQFVDRLAASVEQGLQIDYMKFNSTPDMPKISAIWSNQRRRLNVFQRHDVSKYGFLFELRETMQTNLQVLFLSAYESEGVVYFATIWDARKRKSCKRKKGNLLSQQPKKRLPTVIRPTSTVSAQDTAPLLNGEIDSTIVKQEIDTWQFDGVGETLTTHDDNTGQSSAFIDSTVVKQESVLSDAWQFNHSGETLTTLKDNTEQSSANIDTKVVKQEREFSDAWRYDGSGETLTTQSDNTGQSSAGIDATVVKQKRELSDAWQFSDSGKTLTTLRDNTGQSSANRDIPIVKQERELSGVVRCDEERLTTLEDNTEQSRSDMDTTIVKQEGEFSGAWRCVGHGKTATTLGENSEQATADVDTTSVKQEIDRCQYDDKGEALTTLEDNMDQSCANIDTALVEQELNTCQDHFDDNADSVTAYGNNPKQSVDYLGRIVVKHRKDPTRSSPINGAEPNAKQDTTDVKQETQQFSSGEKLATLKVMLEQFCDYRAATAVNQESTGKHMETEHFEGNDEKLATYENITEQSCDHRHSKPVEQESEKVEAVHFDGSGERLTSVNTAEHESGYSDTTAVENEQDMVKTCQDEEMCSASDDSETVQSGPDDSVDVQSAPDDIENVHSAPDDSVDVQMSGYTDVVYVKQEDIDQLVWQVEINHDDMQVEINHDDMQVGLADCVEVVCDDTTFPGVMSDGQASSFVRCDNTSSSTILCDYAAGVKCEENDSTVYNSADVTDIIKQQVDEMKEELDKDEASVVEQKEKAIKEEVETDDDDDQPGLKMSNKTNTSETDQQDGTERKEANKELTKKHLMSMLQTRQGNDQESFQVYSYEVGYEEAGGTDKQNPEGSENSTAKLDQPTAILEPPVASIDRSTTVLDHSTNHNHTCTESSTLRKHSSVTNSNSSSSVRKASSPMKRKRRTIKPTWKVLSSGLKPDVIVENVEKDLPCSKGMYKQILDKRDV